jgi:lipoprotein-releasing system permease protein
MRFELMVALRYLRAKRKQTVISVITVISILGIAAGTAALIIALGITDGFQSTLQSTLLSATAHVSIMERTPEFGISNWEALMPKLRALPHVIAATPGLYGNIALKGPISGTGAILKGVPLGDSSPVPPMLQHLKTGSLSPFNTAQAQDEIVLGSRLAQEAGVVLHSPVTVISYQGQLTPFGVVPSLYHFRVAGIFESGMYDLDSTWAFTSLESAQRVLDLNDVVNTIELRLDDIFKAPEVARDAERIVGPLLVAKTWMDQNRSLLDALRLEKTVSVITVGLIELVAALNILVVLVMLVMEKNRDIAILMSMGARRQQVQRIFILQGLMIGATGAAIGLAGGYTTNILFNHYRWLKLDEQIYAISYVPFQSHWTDAFWVAGLALLMSFLATLHPSRTASQIAPAEALRYE